MGSWTKPLICAVPVWEKVLGKEQRYMYIVLEKVTLHRYKSPSQLFIFTVYPSDLTLRSELLKHRVLLFTESIITYMSNEYLLHAYKTGQGRGKNKYFESYPNKLFRCKDGSKLVNVFKYQTIFPGIRFRKTSRVGELSSCGN